MKRIATLIVSLFMLWAAPARAQDAQAIEQATQAATAWLAINDAGDYAGSWQQGAPLFQQAVPQNEWQTAIQRVRSQLGALKARQVKSAVFTHSMPGAPDGDYVVIQYQSTFERKASAVETVTPMRDRDGAWRVGGYFIN